MGLLSFLIIASIVRVYTPGPFGENPDPQCRLRAEKGVGLKRSERHQMHFELTPKQYDLLSHNAQTCGLTRKAYLIRLLEGTPVRARPSEEIRKLRTEIHYLGNNINQIARKVNAGFGTAEDIQQCRYLLQEVYQLLYEIANQ